MGVSEKLQSFPFGVEYPFNNFPLKPSGVTSEPTLESTNMPLSLQGSLMPLQY